MKRMVSLLVVSAIFFSGVLLVPLVGLPKQGFRWQAYADAYEPMLIRLNYDSGSPGSFFTVTGFNYPPDTLLEIMANDFTLGTVTTDNLGSFLFIIDTSGAEEGYYFIRANQPNGPSVRLWLHDDQEQRPMEGEGEIFTLPDVAISLISLPYLMK